MPSTARPPRDTGDTPFVADISRHIWRTKYRFGFASDGEAGIRESWARVAEALAAMEAPDQRTAWAARFREALEGFRFLPGGRILAGAGTGHRVTLFNCFVMGRIEDSMDGIFDALKEGALTMQQGGGVGFDFSTLRPRGTMTRHTRTIASGPVSFMDIWDATCSTILSTGARRGAMMATLRCDHPDIEEFVEAKREPGRLTRFNVSVQVTDAFMEAVRDDAAWPLVFPAEALEPEAGSEELLERDWPGYEGPVPCRVMRWVGARELWGRIMRATYDTAEPGVLFVDRVNHWNNLWYREHITASNPCGEEPLPPYGACNLGSVNLAAFVGKPFSEQAELDLDGIRDMVPVAVRMLDNVVDASRFPLEAQAETERANRRLGLGITGLADALIMLGLRYDGEAGRRKAAEVMRVITHAAYHASVDLAREKGPCAVLERERYLQSPFVQSLPEDIRTGITEYGIRNSHLTSIAPTGTISLLANNVSGGLEPAYAFHFRRHVLELDGTTTEYPVEDYAHDLWRRERGEDAPLPEAFVTATELDPQAHLAMQAALQPQVDSSISKTINIPADFPFGAFEDLYQRAYDLGLKGCTTYRPTPERGAVLELEDSVLAPHCCSPEREPD
ncbi:adenosylcobalamin-dependent ribonucleoside-diphosphate reductase [Thiohalorhabdus methylotrophus]|uniref:Vitamin B12-dependent ribonucleotide reductase n=1 Tax=Thiohalorhabdus methylotrophus TaxID=3242694 RepID=A0ABV4TRE5_9GAMM